MRGDERRPSRGPEVLPEPIWVANEYEAYAWMSQWETPQWLTIDTEFNRETTFFPQLGVVQVFADTWQQPLVMDGHQEPPSLLVDWVSDAAITKVVFSGGEDYQILDRWLGRSIENIVDLQWGIALMGGNAQMSLQRAAADYLDIHLPKEHTRSDWSQRPLSPEQIAYAANDVTVLGELLNHVRSELNRLERWEWLVEDTRWQLQDALDMPTDDQAYKRVKGLARLSNLQRHRGSALARWREQQAQEQDRPRGYFMKDDVLVKLAQVSPRSFRDLAKVKGVHQGALRRYGGDWLECLRDPEAQIEEPDMPKDWSDHHKQMLNALREATKQVAARLQIMPEVVASRRHLTALVRWFNGEVDQPPRIMAGWRAHVAEQAWVEACESLDGVSDSNGQH